RDPQGKARGRPASDGPAGTGTGEAREHAGRATGHPDHGPGGQVRGARQANIPPAGDAAQDDARGQGDPGSGRDRRGRAGDEGDQVMADATTTPAGTATDQPTTGKRVMQGIVTRDKTAKTRRV